ncbi:condensation domain-containing protein [Streptomyces sp. NPDC092903]|uniref:condensation domain-containing protein n=1 Tax=Streptomyces sp. NPDC092903 TaxID=3366017 RepID=UPI0038172390
MQGENSRVPLAPIQQHFLHSGGSGAAQNECTAMRIRGALSPSALAQAVSALIQRHEILRSTVDDADGGPVLRVLPAPSTPPLTWLDLSGREAAEREPAMHAAASEFAAAPVDLATGPLLGLLVVRLAEDEHVLALSVHHLIADITAVRIIVDELSRDYAAALSGADSPVPDPGLQYGDFAQWEREALLPLAERTDGEFWRAALAGVPAALDLRTDRPRPALKGTEGRRSEFRFADALGPRLVAFAREHRTTVYAVSLAAFAALVNRSTGAADFVLGVLAANRSAPGTAELVGQFANTLPLRLDVGGDPSFEVLTERCGDTVASAVDHERLALSRILALAGPARDPSRTPLIQHLFLPRLDALGTTSFGGLPITPVEVRRGRGRFDTIVEFEATADAAAAWIEYDTALYTEQGIAELMRDYERLLGALLDEPRLPLSRVAFASGPSDDVRRTAYEAGAPVRSALSTAKGPPGSGALTVVDGAIADVDLVRLREEPGARVIRMLPLPGTETVLAVDLTGLPGEWPVVLAPEPGRLVLGDGAPALSAYTPASLHVTHEDRVIPTGLTARLSPAGAVQLVSGVELVTHSAPAAAASPSGDTLLSLVCELWAETMELPAVRPDDDFFVIGGHSMLAARLVANVSESLDAELGIRALFENPTPGMLTEELRRRYPYLDDVLRLVASATESGPAEEPAPPPRRSQDERLVPLLAAQKQLWLAEQVNPGLLTHTIPLLLRIDGPLDGGALRAAVGDVVARQSGLRGNFLETGNEPVQRIAPFRGFDVPVVDLSHLPPSIRGKQSRALEEETAYGGFDITSDSLLRARLVRLGEHEHVLHLLFHHLVTDEVSMTIFMRELSAFYNARTGQHAVQLDELVLDFAELVSGEQEMLAGREGDRLRRFWTGTLAGAPELDLPTDRPRPERPTHQGEFLERRVPRELADAMSRLAREHRVTAYTVFLTTVVVLLHRLGRQDDFVVGVPTENRSSRGSEQLMGCFLNVVPVRVDCSGDPAFGELLDRVSASLLRSYEHQRLPFAEILDAVRPDRRPDRHPLYQVTCELQLDDWMPLDLNGCTSRYELLSHGTARYELSFHGVIREDAFLVMLEINTGLWERETGLRRIDQVVELLTQVTAEPHTPVSGLGLRPSSQE